jgi:lipopolysaccharide export system protein LptC
MSQAPEIKSDEPPPKRARLDTLPNRARITGAQAAARTRLVRRLRIILPSLALVLIAGLLANTREAGVDDAFLEDFTDLSATTEQYKMANPKFAGVDDDGQPYEITAREALQAPQDKEIVELVEPRAVTQGADKTTVVTAKKGVFRSEANMLDLSDAVTLQHEIGSQSYVLTTPAARVAIREETVDSNSGVVGESEAGVLRADRMRAYNGEGRVVFEGNVSMRIFPKKAKALADESSNAEPETERL